MLLPPLMTGPPLYLTPILHLFDMAGLMVAHAAHNRTPWEYHCQISEAGRDQQLATLTRNGEPLLNWHISQGVVEAGSPLTP